MSRKLVGIDLGTHRIKMCEITASLRGLQLGACYDEPAEIGPEGGASVETALPIALAMLRDHGLAQDPVVVALPGTVASYRLLEFPFADPKRIAQAVTFEVEGQFPQPLDELCVAHICVPGPGSVGRALVVAVRKEMIVQVQRAFEEAGVRLQGVTVAPIALAQALEPEIVPLAPAQGAASEERGAPVTLVADVGHRSTDLLALGGAGAGGGADGARRRPGRHPRHRPGL